MIPALKETRDQFQKVLDVNLTGAFAMAQACARRMERGERNHQRGKRARLHHSVGPAGGLQRKQGRHHGTHP